MFPAILTGVTAYVSTSLDYLLILMLIFSNVKPRQRHLVYWGDVLGTSILVGASLFVAFVLRLMPAQWLLGLLGLIPIYMGVKLAISGEDDDDDAVSSRLRSTSIVTSVAMITIATCGADNIGVYVPLFASQTPARLVIILITFLVMLTLFCWLGAQLGRLPIIADLLERWGRWLTSLVYIGIGLYILIESGTIQHFL